MSKWICSHCGSINNVMAFKCHNCPNTSGDEKWYRKTTDSSMSPSPSEEKPKHPPRVWVNLKPQDEDEEMLDCFLEKPIQGPAVWQSGFLEYVPESLLAQEKAAHEDTKKQLQQAQHFLGKAERRVKTLEEENAAHEETKRELNSCKRSRGCKVADIERLKEENRILAINGAKREDDAFNEGYYCGYRKSLDRFS